MTKLRPAAAIGLSVLLLLPLDLAPAIAAATGTTAAPQAAPQTAAPPKARRARPREEPVGVEEPAGVVEPAALRALQRMSTYLSTVTSFEVKSETSRDLVTNDGQRLMLDGIANYKVRRPDGFVIEVNSDAKKRTYYYNGKTFTVFAPDLKFYATAPAPPTIPMTLDLLYQKFGISLPLQDLFSWSDPTLHRADTLKSGVAVGTSTIDGVETDQFAFREGDIDWQIWIQHDGDPLPRKVVIIDRSDPTHPTYTAELTWNVSPTLAAEDFTFHPGADAKPIRLTSVGQ
jgi:hypothetical protein